MKRMFWFKHKAKTVYTVAGTETFAKHKFQARWGYWPEDAIHSEIVVKSRESKNG